MSDDPPNVVTTLTAPGTSALAAIRVSGPGAAAFLMRRFSKPVTLNRCIHGELRDDDGVLDDPVCVLNADGSVDVTLHGNAFIVDLVLKLAKRDGFRVSDAIHRGETRTIQDEVRDALPLVRTERAARVLLAQVDAWKTGTPDVADRSLYHLLHPPTIAIVGVPNAGKSTLANALFGQRRSIVSDVAGTTRDWVGELVDLDGLVVTLIDTPGIRETTDTIERQAIDASATPIATADVVIVLFDATRYDVEQRALLDRFPGAIIAANKIDVAPAPPGAIPLVARDGVGVDALIRAIHDRLGLNDRPFDAPRCWTSQQVASLTNRA